MKPTPMFIEFEQYYKDSNTKNNVINLISTLSKSIRLKSQFQNKPDPVWFYGNFHIHYFLKNNHKKVIFSTVYCDNMRNLTTADDRSIIETLKSWSKNRFYFIILRSSSIWYLTKKKTQLINDNHDSYEKGVKNLTLSRTEYNKMTIVVI